MPGTFLVVYITTPKGAVASKIARHILKSRAAACVNIVPEVKSSYWWKGKIESAKEALLIVKTTNHSLKKLIAVVKSVHPYTVPEIIALPITDGHKPYLKWLTDETHTRV